MSDNLRDNDAQKTERRAFLEQCGRFAVVTPPVVALMLTVGDKAALATSATTTSSSTIVTTTVMLSPEQRPESGTRLAVVLDSMGLMKS